MHSFLLIEPTSVHYRIKLRKILAISRHVIGKYAKLAVMIKGEGQIPA